MDKVILPIGTVCTLKGANKKIMITAFFIAEDSNSNELYDYCGCLWPEGMIDSQNHFLFNKDKIEKIHHIGFSNEEEKEFKNNLMEIIKEKEHKNLETDKLEDDTKASVENRNDEENIENNSSNSIFNTLDLNQ